MKKFVVGFAFFLGLHTIVSQQKKKKESVKDTVKTEVINVITTYNPTVADAFKVKENPIIKINKNLEKKKLTYQIYSAPVASTFVPKSGSVKSINIGVKEHIYDNYIGLGFGNYTTPYAEIFLQKDSKFNHKYGFYANYISSNDGIKNTILDSSYRNLNAGAYYQQEERYFSWSLGLDYENNLYNWYGLPEGTVLTNNQVNEINETQDYNLYQIKGKILFDDSYIKDIKGKFNYFKDNFDSSESELELLPNFNFPLDYFGRNFKDLELKTSLNLVTGRFDRNYETTQYINYSFLNIGLNPIYRIENDDLSIKLGFKLYGAFEFENSLTDILIYPDVEISHSLLKDVVNIYAGAIGGIHNNSFKSLSDMNPFISPTQFLTQTNEQYNIYAGINGKVIRNITFNIKASYKNEEDKALFFRNNTKFTNTTTSLLGYDFGNSFSVLYDDVSTLSIYGEVEADFTKSFSLGGLLQYNHFTPTNQQVVWNTPEFESMLYGKYKKNKWYGSANIFITGERYDVLYNGTFPSTISQLDVLNSFIDINLDGGYHFSDYFSVFLKLNNILNNNYSRFANFDVQGFQILGGITYKFDFN